MRHLYLESGHAGVCCPAPLDDCSEVGSGGVFALAARSPGYCLTGS